jgi:cysteine desulfurase/selenocysteine lyase
MTAVSGASAVGLAEIAAQFPVLRNRSYGGQPVCYLDSSATSQTPDAAIDAMTSYYTRSTVQETVFTANATAAINMVAYTWGRQNVQRGDLVVLTEMEHHSNIVPWQLLCQDREAELAYVPVTDDGVLDLDALDALLERGPRLVGLVHVSNVLGTVNPVASIARRAHSVGAVVLIDGTQAVPQMPVWLPDLDVDFYAWTGHKAYGPTGIGVLHGRRALLEEMPPFIGGGHMIRTVAANESTWTDLPWKFEAGTSQIAEAIGLGAAVDWIRALGMDAIRAHEQALVAEVLERLVASCEVPGLSVQGPLSAADRGALVSFTLDGAHPHVIADILGGVGVCVRAGHHCAQPLMRRLGVPATTRASFYMYNTRDEVDALVAGLDKARSMFGR